MLIVLEGADGTGKSTLADLLATRLASGVGDAVARGPQDAYRGDARVEILPRRQLERHPLVEYVRDLDGYVPGAGGHAILDRWHLGELIYGPLYRQRSQLDEAGRRYVDLYLRSRGALIVICDADERVVRARLDKRGEDFLRPEHLRSVLASYRQQVYRSAPFVATLTVLTDLESPAVASDRILLFARALEDQALNLRNEANYVGSPRARVLLVGERSSPRHGRDLPTHATPFVPYSGGAAHALLSALEPDLLADCGIVNAMEVNLGAVWSRLGYPRVIGLGRVAQNVLTRYAIPHHDAPHPQWVRRFHHARLGDYGRMLTQLADATSAATAQLITIFEDQT